MPDLNKFKEEVAFDESIDWPTLEALVKQDEEGDKDVSKNAVYDFFKKAQKSFTDIDRALKKDDLAKVGKLATDLKESAATVGCTTVKDTAEKIEYLADGKDEFGEAAEQDEEESIKRIRPRAKQAKVDFEKYEKQLKKFYGDEE